MKSNRTWVIPVRVKSDALAALKATVSAATEPGGSGVDPGNNPAPGNVPATGKPPTWVGGNPAPTCPPGTKGPVWPTPGENWPNPGSGIILLPTPPKLPANEPPKAPGELNCLPSGGVTFTGGERRPGSTASTSLILSTRIVVVVVGLAVTCLGFGTCWGNCAGLLLGNSWLLIPWWIWPWHNNGAKIRMVSKRNLQNITPSLIKISLKVEIWNETYWNMLVDECPPKTARDKRRA